MPLYQIVRYAGDDVTPGAIPIRMYPVYPSGYVPNGSNQQPVGDPSDLYGRIDYHGFMHVVRLENLRAFRKSLTDNLIFLYDAADMLISNKVRVRDDRDFFMSITTNRRSAGGIYQTEFQRREDGISILDIPDALTVRERPSVALEFLDAMRHHDPFDYREFHIRGASEYRYSFPFYDRYPLFDRDGTEAWND